MKVKTNVKAGLRVTVSTTTSVNVESSTNITIEIPAAT